MPILEVSDYFEKTFQGLYQFWEDDNVLFLQLWDMLDFCYQVT